MKIFSYAGSTRVQVKALADSHFLTRNIEAARFTYHGFVAYCVLTVDEEKRRVEERREAIRQEFLGKIRALVSNIQEGTD